MYTLNTILIYASVTGVEKPSLNLDLNPGSLANRASTLPSDLFRPDILTDSHTWKPADIIPLPEKFVLEF